jgi:quinolinate synthase
MAETASILCPDKKVLLPDLEAGCSLAEMITAEDVRVWRQEHPQGLDVSYVNTSADVKAESDYCCTSSNAVKVVESLPKDVPILFIPDFFLGNFVKQKTGRNIHLWRGYCPAHTIITSESVTQLKHDHPKAEFLMHPECGCSTKSMHLADQVMSTEGMVRYAQESKAGEFIVATETGILHKMRKQSPEKKFFAANEQAVCGFMKKVTLEKIVWALENLKYEVKVPREIAQKALKPIERMLAIR